MASFIDPFVESRTIFSARNKDFKTNRGRIKILKGSLNNSLKGKVLYWMNRDYRAQDNWSLIYAQEIANTYELGIEVMVCLNPLTSGYYRRHYYFMIEGLIELEKELRNLNINFYVIQGGTAQTVIEYVRNNPISVLITDMNPLPTIKNQINTLVDNIDRNVVIIQVDTHNIVPVWVASNKVEFAARTIRPKINSHLKEYLTEFVQLKVHHINDKCTKANDWNSIKNYIDKNIDKDNIFNDKYKIIGGYSHGVGKLQHFINNLISDYASKRNDPNENKQSGCSPYFNYGFISCQRAIIEIIKTKKMHPESVAAFCEEAIIRRELSDNFCYYSDSLTDKYEWIPAWGKKTLEKHQNDQRPYNYARTDLENADTHDKLWNASQIQMMVSGKMHGYLRMYWCKKILEWAENPYSAINDSIYLNDKYNIDGNNPNGITGCLWSIGGVHDRPWRERPIFGLIRYMNYEGCCRKFDVNRFVRLWLRNV